MSEYIFLNSAQEKANKQTKNTKNKLKRHEKLETTICIPTNQ